ncbi:MAG: nucleotidyltransferase [Bacteroidales bacterium]|nr:nucleotidyltransferase [Bacteroidales bacterium]
MNSLQFYSETLKALNKTSVEYLVVGGYAVNIYGYMRSTADMDIWVDNSEKNLEKIKQALLILSYPKNEVVHGIEELSAKKNISLKHNEFFKIELISFLSSTLKFSEAYQRKTSKTILGVQTTVIDFGDLCNLKIKSGRQKDLLDVNELKKLHNK